MSYVKFAVKTFVYLLSPTLFSRVRAAKQLKSTHPPKVAPAAWAEGSGAVRRRAYSDYAQYVSHQAAKYTIMLARGGGNARRSYWVYRLKFWLRFRRVARLLPKNAVIVCAGARDGTEVEVWRDMGFRNAVGFDLNPGPSNPFVTQADFNYLPLLDDCADAVYSNCVDHAFGLKMMFAEAQRVLKPGGLFLYDISTSKSGLFESVDFRPEDALVEMVAFAGELLEVRRWRQWMQVTARK